MISQSRLKHNVQYAIALIQATTIYSSLTVDKSSVPGSAAKDPAQSQALGFVAGKFHPFPCLLPQQFPARKLPRMSTNTVIIHLTTEHIPPRQKPQTERQQRCRPRSLNARSPAAVAVGRDARGTQPRMGEARRNARIGGPHEVQDHDASHQAHTARHQTLQAPNGRVPIGHTPSRPLPARFRPDQPRQPGELEHLPGLCMEPTGIGEGLKPAMPMTH